MYPIQHFFVYYNPMFMNFVYLLSFFIEMDTLHILEDRGAHNPTNQPNAGPQI